LFTELTDILKGLKQNITADETGLLQKKLSEMNARYSNYPALAPLLKMMGSLGKYLDSKKSKAHPDAVPVLISIAGRFEEIIHEFNMDRDKDRIHTLIAKEIRKYKALQSKLAVKPVAGDIDFDKLKAVILAIDWEISDGTIQHFEKVVREFLSVYQHDKIHHHFLRIIRSLGQYIGSRKADAHPDAISFLRSVSDDFEKAVRTPGLSHENKKAILEKTLHEFNRLKIELSKEKQKLRPAPDAPYIAEEEFLPPALSHIKAVSGTSPGDVMPIPLSSEPDEPGFSTTTADTDDILPALSGRERPPSAHRDVMGDLFSLKESPADELLDAIHLMDVHGPDQGRTPHIQGQALHSPAGGIKQFTPELKHNEPLPEIEDRLDEFFNLETPAGSLARPAPPAEDTVEFTAEPEEDTTEGIVPFQYEDESFDPGDTGPGDEGHRKERVSDILDRLKTSLKTLDEADPQPGLLSIKKDISELTALRQDDPEKRLLLELLDLSLRFLENPARRSPAAGDATAHERNEPIPEYFRERPPGLLARIKALFTP